MSFLVQMDMVEAEMILDWINLVAIVDFNNILLHFNHFVILLFIWGSYVDQHNEVQNKIIPQRQKQDILNQPADEDNDEDTDYGLVSSRARIGLAGGRGRRSRSPMVTALIWIIRLNYVR